MTYFTATAVNTSTLTKLIQAVGRQSTLDVYHEAPIKMKYFDTSINHFLIIVKHQVSGNRNSSRRGNEG
jgi:hypothetical protein